MNQYTVSADFVEHCGPDNPCNRAHWLNVLIVFCQDRPCKLCLDDRRLALELYQKLGERYEPVRFWLQSLLNNTTKKTVIVRLPDGNYDDACTLFATIAARTISKDRKLIVQDKQKYSHLLAFIQDNDIRLLDGDEAKSLLAPPVIQQYINGNNNNQQINL